MESFWSVAEQYLCAEAGDHVELRAALARTPDRPVFIAFKTEFRQVLDTRCFSLRELELRLNFGFDEEDEAYAWMEQVWAYLYEGGPYCP